MREKPHPKDRHSIARKADELLRPLTDAELRECCDPEGRIVVRTDGGGTEPFRVLGVADPDYLSLVGRRTVEQARRDLSQFLEETGAAEGEGYFWAAPEEDACHGLLLLGPIETDALRPA